MKLIFIVSFLFALTLAAPSYTKSEEPSGIVSFVNNNSGLGPYNFSFETTDGTKRQEEAVLVNPNDPNSGLIVRGFYTYRGEDGNFITVTYEADENGYRVVDQPLKGRQQG